MKRLFLAAIVLMLSVASFAQSEVGTLSIKPRAGINIAYFGESQNSMWSVSTSPRIGVAAGFELEYLVQKRVGISAGVIYSQQGEKGETGNWYSKTSMKAKTDYINFPILANVYLYKGLALKLGVQPGVNVNASYTAGDYKNAPCLYLYKKQSCQENETVCHDVQYTIDYVCAGYGFKLLQAEDAPHE